MKDDEMEEARRKAEQSATAWFAVLDRAREVGDFEKAAEAQRQLSPGALKPASAGRVQNRPF